MINQQKVISLSNQETEDIKDHESEEEAEGNEEEDSEEEDDDYILILDFKDDWWFDLLEQINGKYKLPHMAEIYLDSLEDVNSNAVKFLQSTITSCDRLFINKKPLQKHVKTKIDITSYLDCILKVLPKLTENEGNCLIGYMSITSNQFNKIIKASSHLEFASFNWWKLQFDEGLNFEIDSDYKIRVIALTGCGHGFNGGILNEASFQHFIAAIAKTSLKTSLKQLSITWWNISSETINKLLADHNIEGISIWA